MTTTDVTPEAVRVRYTNWRGETSNRRLLLGALRFGTTDWHPEPTWLILAFDVDHPAQIWKEFDLTKCDFTLAAERDALRADNDRLRDRAQRALVWMEQTRASGDVGFWEWEPDDEYSGLRAALDAKP
jgi:hypothetical protein